MLSWPLSCGNLGTILQRVHLLRVCIVLSICFVVAQHLFMSGSEAVHPTKRSRGRPARGSVSNVAFENASGQTEYVHVQPVPPVPVGRVGSSAPVGSEGRVADNDSMFHAGVFGGGSNSGSFELQYASLLSSKFRPGSNRLGPVALSNCQVTYCLPDYNPASGKLDWGTYVCPSLCSTQFLDGVKETFWCTCSEDMASLRGVFDNADMSSSPKSFMDSCPLPCVHLKVVQVREQICFRTMHHVSELLPCYLGPEFSCTISDK